MLRGLAAQLGPEVFDDPDNFRGALDDVLDEEASLGEQNLVVDAVRLGAYASMVTILRQGGEPASAVAQAGAMLARDRGGDDRTSASWACACLAYAVGAVDEAAVRYYRTAQAPPEPAPSIPTAPPPPPYSPPPPVPAPDPERPRGQRLVPVLVAVAVLLAAVAGVVGASLLMGDDDPPASSAPSDPDVVGADPADHLSSDDGANHRTHDPANDRTHNRAAAGADAGGHHGRVHVRRDRHR